MTWQKPAEKRRLKLHHGQCIVAQSKARFRVVVAGRRWGKTAFSKSVLIEEATIGPKRRVWYIAPSYRMAKQIMWEDLKNSVPRRWIKKINETELSIRLVNNSIIECKGADDPDSLRGVGLHAVVMDEFQDMKEGTWSTVIRPTLAKDRGRALFIGTPRGYANLYDVYKLGIDPKNKAWASWQFPTSSSPFIPKSEIDAAKQDMDLKTFKQEFQACHLPETEVKLWNGQAKQISRLKRGDLIAYLNDQGELLPCEVMQLGVTGVKPIADVTLETGEVISASNHHRFKVHVNE